MPPYDFSLQNQFMPCECCKPKYTTVTCTATAGGWKWSEKEIKENILRLAERLARSKWYNQGDLRRQLKHWTDKLKRYRELKGEFF